MRQVARDEQPCTRRGHPDGVDADGAAGAADYLGGFKYPDVIAALDAALGDPDARVRAAAAGALWKIGKPAVLALVRKAMPK